MDEDNKIDKKPLIFAIIGICLPVAGLPFSIIALNRADKLVDKTKHWSYIVAMILGGLGIMTCFTAVVSVIKALVT